MHYNACQTRNPSLAPNMPYSTQCFVVMEVKPDAVITALTHAIVQR
jgi:hypothetical protein